MADVKPQRKHARGATDYFEEDCNTASWLFGKDGIFQPYPPKMSGFLESAFKKKTTETLSICDAEGNTWIVDVSTLTHTHSETGEVLEVKRMENEQDIPQYLGDAALYKAETAEAWTPHDVARMMTEMQAEMDRLSKKQNSKTVIWGYVQAGRHISYPEDFCNVLEVILHTPNSTNKQTPYISESGSTAMVDLSNWTHTFMDTYEQCQLKRRYKKMDRKTSCSLRVKMTPSFSQSSYLSDTDDRDMWHADDTDEPSEDMRQEIRKLSSLFTPPDKDMLEALMKREKSYTANSSMTPDIQDSFLRVANTIEFSVSKSISTFEEEADVQAAGADSNLIREGDVVQRRDAKRLGDALQEQIAKLELENKAKKGKNVWTYMRNGKEVLYPESFATILEVIYISDSSFEEKRSPYIEPDSQDTCIIDLSLMIHKNLVTGECWPVKRQHVKFKQDPGKSRWSMLSYFGLGKKKLKTSDIERNMQAEYEQAISTEHREKRTLRDP